MPKLSSQPYKGARDFYPEDQKIQNYLFDTWRRVCLSYGFEEYNGPFLEPFELYAAKSGQELVNDQLYSFEDRSGRKLAIRPEMTPTVARMIAARSKAMIKPLKWFSIAQFWRYESPQRGRLREFFQLNADIFGENSVLADFEVFSLGASIMKTLGATPAMYEIRVNNRIFMDYLLEKTVGLSPAQKQMAFKAIDRRNKIGAAEFEKVISDKLQATRTQAATINKILNYQLDDVLKLKSENVGAQQMVKFFDYAQDSEFADVFVFDPAVVRGLDYYTGLVIEQWDKNPQNRRSLYGGGRYDGLTNLFDGAENLPATGFAQGDVTLLNFLESWNLLPQLTPATQILVTLLPGFDRASLQLAQSLRARGLKAELWLNPTDSLDKQLKYADRKQIPHVIILGEKEIKENKVAIKNLKTGEQTLVNEMSLDEVLKGD